MSLVRRFSNLFARSKVGQEIDAELESHLAMRIEDNIASGMSPEEARRDALLRFGNPTVLKERVTAADAALVLDSIRRDIQYGIHGLLKSPGFTITATLTLALGIGINSSLYSLASGILRQLPIREVDRVGAIVGTNASFEEDHGPLSAAEFLFLHEQARSFSEIAAGDSSGSLNLTESGDPERLRAFQVSPNYFQLVGATAQLGRTLIPGDDRPGQSHVVVLSQSLWQRRFGLDPGIIGRAIRLDGEKYTVVGVMPGYFKQAYYPVDLWTPLIFGAGQSVPRADAPRYLLVFTRLKPGLTFAQAKAEVQALDQRYEATVLKAHTGWGASVIPVEDYFAPRTMRIMVALLMSVAGFVLLIVCGNISGLLIARGGSREKEFAIRRALGAGTWRLTRQLMIENLLLSLLGGGFALWVALGGVHLLRARLDFNPSGAFIANKITINGGVLAFTLGLSVCAALLFGLLPAFETSHLHPGGSLQEVDRTGSSGRRPSRLRSILVVVQITLALILLTCCAVVIKGLYDLDQLNAGFDPEQVITAGLQLSQGTYDNAAKQRAFVEASVQRIANLPGVHFAAATTNIPISLARMVPFTIEGQPITKPEERPWARYFAITPDYLHVMNITLLRGRGFMSSDDASRPPIALVNEAFVKQFFAKGEVLGKHVSLALTPSSDLAVSQIVGVVVNVADYQGQSSFQPQIYFPYAQHPDADLTLVARTTMNPKGLMAPLRQAVWSVDRNQPLDNPRTMTQVVTTTNGGNRMIVLLLEIFAVLALLLVAIGIYGVIAFTVSQRTREIGIRLALGAHRRAILMMVMKNGMKRAAIGLLVGLPLSAPIPHLLQRVLQVHMVIHTAAVLVGVPVFVTLIAITATYMPALRASRVDPMHALRYE
jgi:putative ABC transport system permease protein